MKKDTNAWLAKHRVGARVRAEVGDAIRERFLSDETTLVPVPGHAPMKDPKSRWGPRDICRVLVENGAGARWLPLLERVVAVKKSAWASKEERELLTPAAHFDTIRSAIDMTAGERITVVDDVVTSGKTMLACIARLRAAYPRATVRGFALIRTMSDDAIQQVKEPCAGTIELTSWGARREP